MPDPARYVDPADAALQLERILHSQSFAKAERSKRLLQYLLTASTLRPAEPVKEYVLALDVFDRDSSYDPGIDATVRVEASRLRGRLREYYDDEGRDDPIRIQMPKGRYGLTFEPYARRRATDATPEAESPALRSTAEVQGKRISKRWLWLSVTSAALLMTVGLTAAMHRRAAGSASIAGPPQPVRLALLPMVNRTGDPTWNAPMDGMADDMIRQLANVPALRLMAHATVFRYRSFTGDATALGRSLGVQYVATGLLKRNPQDELALDVELTQTSTGTLMLDREFLVDRHDLQSLQAKVQRELIGTLHAESAARDPGRPFDVLTGNEAAYEQFLIADSLAKSGSPGDLHQAITHLERATSLDPSFALAWSALASAHVLLGMYAEAPQDHMPVARIDARRALDLNPTLGEAHGTLGIIDLVYDRDRDTARRELVSASAQQAAMGTLSCTAHLIERSGDPRTAEEMLQRMRTYDPQSGALIAEIGCVHYYRGDYRLATRYYREAIESDPQSPVAYWGLGKTLVALGHPQEALDLLRSFKARNGSQPAIITSELGYTLGSMGHTDQALAQVRMLVQQRRTTYVDPFLIATVYSGIGDRHAAYQWIEIAIRSRSPFVVSLATEHQWDACRDDPRFQAILREALPTT